MMWIDESISLRGNRSRKGKKRRMKFKHGQTIHTTKNGIGIIGKLRKNKGKS